MDAIAQRDGDWFRRNLAEDFVYVDILGGLRDRENVIRMDAGIGDTMEATLHEQSVRTFGADLAIVHSLVHARIGGTGAELSPELQELYRQGVDMAFTDVWQRQGGCWIALTHHATRVVGLGR
jgi:hypothetical protein